MNIDGVSEQGFRHRRAFDVPAGSATAPGRVPAGLLVAGGLPQHEIASVFLVRRHFHTRPRQHLAPIALGQHSIIVIGTDVEQNMSFGCVGMSAIDQALDHRNDLRQMLGDSRLVVGRRHAQGLKILVVSGGIAVADHSDRDTFTLGGGIDLVVDVGDVADVDHALVPMPQQARQHIEHDRRSHVADVRIGIDRGATDIHRDPRRILRDELLLAAGQRIVQLHRIRAGSKSRAGYRQRAAKSRIVQPNGQASAEQGVDRKAGQHSCNHTIGRPKIAPLDTGTPGQRINVCQRHAQTPCHKNECRRSLAGPHPFSIPAPSKTGRSPRGVPWEVAETCTAPLPLCVAPGPRVNR